MIGSRRSIFSSISSLERASSAAAANALPASAALVKKPSVLCLKTSFEPERPLVSLAAAIRSSAAACSSSSSSSAPPGVPISAPRGVAFSEPPPSSSSSSPFLAFFFEPLVTPAGLLITAPPPPSERAGEGGSEGGTGLAGGAGEGGTDKGGCPGGGRATSAMSTSSSTSTLPPPRAAAAASSALKVGGSTTAPSVCQPSTRPTPPPADASSCNGGGAEAHKWEVVPSCHENTMPRPSLSASLSSSGGGGGAPSTAPSRPAPAPSCVGAGSASGGRTELGTALGTLRESLSASSAAASASSGCVNERCEQYEHWITSSPGTTRIERMREQPGHSAEILASHPIVRGPKVMKVSFMLSLKVDLAHEPPALPAAPPATPPSFPTKETRRFFFSMRTSSTSHQPPSYRYLIDSAVSYRTCGEEGGAVRQLLRVILALVQLKIANDRLRIELVPDDLAFKDGPLQAAIRLLHLDMHPHWPRELDLLKVSLALKHPLRLDLRLPMARPPSVLVQPAWAQRGELHSKRRVHVLRVCRDEAHLWGLVHFVKIDERLQICLQICLAEVAKPLGGARRRIGELDDEPAARLEVHDVALQLEAIGVLAAHVDLMARRQVLAPPLHAARRVEQAARDGALRAQCLADPHDTNLWGESRRGEHMHAAGAVQGQSRVIAHLLGERHPRTQEHAAVLGVQLILLGAQDGARARGYMGVVFFGEIARHDAHARTLAQRLVSFVNCHLWEAFHTLENDQRLLLAEEQRHPPFGRIRVAIRGTQRTHLLELLALASLLSLLLLFEFGALLSLLLIVLPLTLRVGFLELRQPLRVDELLWGNGA
eukprot:jgi/Chrpa1/14749/Chrysochromulina_OHIO_Genome00010776-RA